MLQEAAKRLFVPLGNQGIDSAPNLHPAVDFSTALSYNVQNFWEV